MNTQSVSVVIPAYLAQRHLRRAVESVLAQTALPREIIVVENMSPDGTLALALELAREHAGLLRVLRQPQRGAAAARQRGIQAACGRWVAFLDADDWWLPNKLQAQLRCAAANPHAAMVHVRGCRQMADGTWQAAAEPFPSGQNWCEQYLARRFSINPSMVMVRRDVLMEVGGFDTRITLTEDTDLWIRIAARWPVVPVDEACVVHPRGHAESTIRRAGELRMYQNDAQVWRRSRRLFLGRPRLLAAWRRGYGQLLQLIALELNRANRPLEAAMRYFSSVVLSPGDLASWQARLLWLELLGPQRVLPWLAMLRRRRGRRRPPARPQQHAAALSGAQAP